MAKKSAATIWQRMKVDNSLFEIIMEALENQKKSRQWTDKKGQFIPHPTTWLNQERWNDEIKPPNNKDVDKFSTIELTKIYFP